MFKNDGPRIDRDKVRISPGEVEEEALDKLVRQTRGKNFLLAGRAGESTFGFELVDSDPEQGFDYRFGTSRITIRVARSTWRGIAKLAQAEQEFQILNAMLSGVWFMWKSGRLVSYTCLRCEHDWFPRIDGRPRTCPECGSPYWDAPRKVKKGVSIKPSRFEK